MADTDRRKQIDEMIADIEKIIYADSKTALKKALLAYRLSKESDYCQAEAILQLKIGFIHSNISEYTKGIDYIMTSIPKLEAHNLYYHVCSAYIMLGNIFFELANYETSFDYYNKSVYIAGKHQYPDRLSIAYNNIGEIYKNLSNYERAIYYYEKGISEDQLMACKGIAHLNLAEINYYRENYDEALKLLPVALELLTKYNYELHFCEVYKIYALVYWKLKDYEKAEHNFLAALHIANEKSIYFNKINILIQYHQFLEEQEQNERAIQVLNDAYLLSKANSIHEKSLEICFYFTQIYEKISDRESVLKYYKLYMFHNQEQIKDRNKQIKEGISLRVRTDEIKLQSEIDALTGIPNRREFLRYYNRQWSNSKLQGYSLALIMMDIDFFKEYNDNYGHIEGDRHLTRIAALLTDLLGKKHFLSRYGGDEFIVVLPDTDLQGAVDVAESLRQAVMAEKIEHRHSEISEYVTVTCGVAAVVPNDETNADCLIKQADDALYEAKKNGRNRVMGNRKYENMEESELKKVYTIRKMKEEGTARDINWDKTDKAEIACYPWDQNGYRPKTEAAVMYDAKGLHIFLLSFEKEIMATREKQNDAVFRDSCMEFFFKPSPEKDDRYFNFEFNPLGTMTLGLGSGRNDRIRFADNEIFEIRTSVTKETLNNYNGSFWSIQFMVPFEFIERHFGKLDFKSGMKMTGNFQKCAVDTEYPHYGCWNEITSKAPDFHRPECFGDLILE